MRIVTWNCGGALRRKRSALDSLEADILVIQECESPANSRDTTYQQWAGNHLWIGTDKNKGLGVFARTDLSLTPLPREDHGLQLLLTCQIDDLTLLAVWTKKSDSTTFRYIGQLWKWLQFHQDLLTAERALLLGDLNSNAIWDAQHRGCSHSDVVRILDQRGMVSLYHHTRNERHGGETIPTLFFRRDQGRPYHIDYAFLSPALLASARVDIGDPATWLTLSDHMPVVVDLAP